MNTRPYLFMAFILLFSQPVFADDKEQLTQLLHHFLQGVDSAAQHDRFWAEDLIYTSSSGSRFGKAEIMAGFAPADATEQDSTAAQTYAAEDIDVRLFDTTAVVAFKLVGSSAGQDGAELTYYLNTGTFVKRAGQWRAVAWQATKIPEPK
ncbi:nuclear transport factor 2 family protein [Simiduia curdlanivorans]|uniref:Nuclear transport factor 2 family protein n=1 Tax=Simiduia curdlanivorans TaxID=1492769 RepID=A0ABV8V6R9_9GAMM|nr:nuclear transport factor 2 family protein [Simiduia curdlanivorans]MDN3638738.1 nuclear transport factor 2 family protein [Simiduia curdlanivorans]